MTASRQSRHSIPGLAFLVAAAIVVGGCGGEGEGSDSPPPPPDYEKALADAPPPLAALYRQANELLPGGPDAFEARIEELRGYPIVVNKWASWCGPCRAEFPLFQELAAERGDEIAFLGANSSDSEDAARTFLDQYPVPYPSYSDPDHEIGDLLQGAREFPATAFYDAEGELDFVHRGGYVEKRDLAADIERHAR